MWGGSTGLNTTRRMVVVKGFHQALRSLIVGAVACACALGAYAAQGPEAEVRPLAVSYASVSDQELTDIAARWDDLDAQQRRALLSEVTLRMKRSGDAQGILRVKVRRRYGKVVRHPNGATATLRIEVTSVQQDQKDQKDQQKGQQEFGVGFEQRSRQGGDVPEEPEPAQPVVRVADPE